MRKEVLFAIIAGAVFGLVVAFGIWRANIAIKSTTEEIATSNSQEEKPQTTQTEEKLGLTLAKPDSFDVITESPTLISGITKPNAWVVISTDAEDYIIQTPNSGAFEKEIELEPGVNQIILSAFDESSDPVQDELTLVYSTEFIKDLEAIDKTDSEEEKE